MARRASSRSRSTSSRPNRRAFLGPVYLLTSDVTLSAGEVFALYMRALPNVIQVGGNTRGAFSDMIEKPLPNGWTLSLSAEVYRDPQGQSYEAQGLPPQRKFRGIPARRSDRRARAPACYR